MWGCGGHGKVVAELTRLDGFEVVGFIDRDPAKFGMTIDAEGASVIATEDNIRGALVEGTSLPHDASTVALGVGDNSSRMKILDDIDRVLIGPLVHPRATVSSSAKCGAGSVVFAGAVINADASIGRGVIINSAAVVEHDCTIDDGAHVSPGAILTGNVTVGRLAWVGAGAVILPGLLIGERAIVGAGAVVRENVPPRGTVVGNPARSLPAQRE